MNKQVKTKVKTVKTTTSDEVIVVQAEEKLSLSQYNLLSEMVKQESENKGVKIILLPKSVELKEENKTTK